MSQIGREREREKEEERALYYGFAVIQPKSRRRLFRRSEVNQRAVVIEVAISRANVTHERDLGENLPFLCARKAASFYFAFPIMRLFGSLVPPRAPFVPFFRALFLEAVPFLQSQRSPSRSFSFLARRFLVSLPSFLHPFALFHLRFSPPLLSINLFFSLRSSGPRNEQRKSIGWHCGFVPSTVVLDLCIGTMYGTCFIKLKSLLRSDVFCTSVLRYSFVPLNLIEIVSVILN